MQLSLASYAGSPDKENEDAVALLGDFIIVADGVTARTETGCIHGVAWFARHLAASMVQHAEQGPYSALAEGIRETANAHRLTCDLENTGTPSAAVAIARVQPEDIDFLALGDVTVVVETVNGIELVVDDRVSKTALPERALADSYPHGSPEKAAALDWPAALELLASDGPSALIDRVRTAERADPAAVKWPRNKISDDATVVYAEF